MSIEEIVQKCKSSRVFMPVILLLTALLFFGLGRLSVLVHKKAPVTIMAPNELPQ